MAPRGIQHQPATLIPLMAVVLLLTCHTNADTGVFSCKRQCSFESSKNMYSLSLLERNPGAIDSGNSTWMYGIFTVRMKLQAGYSGGTITAFYLVDTETQDNADPDHSEIDLELYGGQDGRHMVFATNIYAGGKQNLDQLRLPLDASADFNNFTIQWSKSFISWKLNGVPLRTLYRDPSHPWPSKPMQVRVSVWDSSSFTTLKADYSRTGAIVTQVKEGGEGGFVGCQRGGDPLSPPNCPDWTDSSHPWNVRPTLDESEQGEAVRQKNFIDSFGWDSA